MIKTGSWTRSIKAVLSRGDELVTEEGTIARCEMESHAETCGVAGPNFKILEFTGEQCDVTLTSAATAFTDELTGGTLILRFNQVVWYGNRMKMSLINPNQLLRHYGVMASDDPTDSTRAFGITTTEDRVHVPFKMDDATTVYFETRVPTQYELENCMTIHLTDETVLEPSSVSIASVAVTSDLPMVKISGRRKISAMSVRNNNGIPPSEESFNDLIPYNDATFLNRMIGNVRVATAYCEACISFLGSQD